MLHFFSSFTAVAGFLFVLCLIMLCGYSSYFGLFMPTVVLHVHYDAFLERNLIIVNLKPTGTAIRGLQQLLELSFSIGRQTDILQIMCESFQW